MEMLIKLFRQYKEVIMYLIFGVMTTLVNLMVYSLTVSHISMTYANMIAWFIAVIFAFFTNKIFVFESKTWKVRILSKEIASFFGSRIFSGFIEIVGPTLLFNFGLNQELFNIKGFLAKIIVSVLVVVLNYVFSKLIVFKKNKSGTGDFKNEKR